MSKTKDNAMVQSGRNHITGILLDMYTNDFFVSLNEEQLELYNKIHVLHVARMYNSRGESDKATLLMADFIKAE